MSTPDNPPAPVPAKKSNTLVIVLCVVLGVFLLILASCVGTCIYVGKKAKDYSAASEKHPQIAALAIAAAIAPGVEVVSKDLDAGTVVLKNTKTGEVVTLDAKSFSQDKVAALIEQMAQGKGVNVNLQNNSSGSATGSDANATSSGNDHGSADTGHAEVLEVSVKDFHPDFPLYMSGGAKAIEASRNVFGGVVTTQYTFLTSDSPSKVGDYYAAKLKSAGYAVTADDKASDDSGVTINRVYQKGGMGNTINLVIQVVDGKTHADVNHVVLK